MQSKYEVIGIVGEGSYGIVYKCRNKKNGEFVAIKKFKEEEDDLVKKTISRELRVLQMLKHDNIVEFKEAFKMKGNLFLVFEYVDKNLLELLQEHPKGLDPGLIKKLIYQMCKSVKYLHGLNIVHRDIKPENLLVDEQNRLKLCDFGFARTIKSTQEKLTDYVATRWYRSPELLITSGYYGPEVDYWAIGCIMGELADGDPMFPGDNEIDQLNVIQKVIGRLPDFQYDMFYNNPQYKNARLLEVNKPETLERRYLGKLSRQAISFMKGLLHPDPVQRLNGETVFNHPYFESYNDPFPKSDNNLNTSQLVVEGHVSNTTRPPVSTQLSQTSFKPKTMQPIISNTTNINIINYNYGGAAADVKQDEKLSKTNLITSNPEKSKILEKINNKGISDNMVMTSYNFNGIKDNYLSTLYTKTSFDKNFKTFYKGEQYNYDLDLNFLKKKPTEGSPTNIDKLGVLSKNKTSDTKPKHNIDIYRDENRSHSPKVKKKLEPIKNKALNSIIYEENYNVLKGPTKFSNLKLTGKGFKDFQLPYIQNKILPKKK
jgi:serine/threonine protein kinase